jgi:hypothetical protein
MKKNAGRKRYNFKRMNMHSFMNMHGLLPLFFFAFNISVFAQGKNDICLVDTREYPGKDRAMWASLYAAKNGDVYTGLCTEGSTAHFYVYLASRDENKVLYDMAEFLDETGKGIRTSSKIHNKPVEDNEGNIYFVPLNNGSGPRNIDFTSWIGGHWMKFNPKTSTLENLGLVDDGCYPIAIDKERKFLFGVGFTGYFYRFDLEKRVTKNFGRVTNWDICRSIFSNDKGDVYGCFPTGRIWKYDGEQQKVIDLSILLPYDPTVYPTELSNPMIDRTNDWRAVEWDPMDKVAYGVTCGSGSLLFRFDTHDGPEGKITTLARMCDTKFLGSDKKNIPYSTLAFAVDSKNKKIYFVPSAREYSIGRMVETFGTGEASHLIMYDIKTEKRIDLGALQTKDGRKVGGCEAASVGADGTVYICGQVEVSDPAKATSRIGGKPGALQLIIYKPY